MRISVVFRLICCEKILTGSNSDGEDLKSKFSRDSGQSFVCPNRGGCTITIALRAKIKIQTSTSHLLPKEKEIFQAGPLVIAAVRILVGLSG